jgi:hypothetical protein
MLTQMKLSLAAMLMITRSSFIALFITSVPVFADTLVVGSIYFDSEQTLKEVINLSAQHDNEGIAKLIQNGHISDLTREEKDIVILISGSTPESPTEFFFLNGSTPFWTLTKNVINFAKPTPTPLPTLTLEATALPTESPTPSSKQHNRQNEINAPFTGDKGKRIWHQVDGKRKWSPANNRHVTGWPAATRPTPTANSSVSHSPAAALPTASPRSTPTPLIMNEGTDLYNSDFTQPFKNYRKPAGQ